MMAKNNEAGFKLWDALGGQVIIGIVNVLFTLIAIWKIDQLGRRPLLIYGVSGILVFLVTIGFLFFFGVDSGTFWMFALLTLPALYIAIKLLPETKGKSLEEIIYTQNK